MWLEPRLILELALLGRFIVLPEVLLYRRMGKTTFTCLLKGDQIGLFYGEQAMDTFVGHLLKMHLDVIRSTLTMPLPWPERLAAFTFAMQHLAWDRGRIWNELRHALGSRKA